MKYDEDYLPIFWFKWCAELYAWKARQKGFYASFEHYDVVSYGNGKEVKNRWGVCVSKTNNWKIVDKFGNEV